MSVDFYLAPAGSGKTQYVIERVRSLLNADPFSPVIVVLPNHLQVREFRRRTAAAGGALGGEFFTFYALYAYILSSDGQPMPRLFDAVQIRLIQDIVVDLYKKGKLVYYANLRDRPGFITVLRNLFQELKESRIFPGDFSSAVKGSGPRLEELATAYSVYQNWLRRENWADAEGQGWLAAQSLHDRPDIARDLRLLVVDGFDEFNPTQLEVLKQLVPRAQDTLITLTGDNNRVRKADQRFRRSQEVLNAKLGGQFKLLPVARHLDRSAALAHLEKYLFELPHAKLEAHESVEFIEAQTRTEEARAALRWAKARLVRDRIDPADIAIFARDIEAYRSFIAETAEEFEVPLRMAGGFLLAENPAIHALLSLIGLPIAGWPCRQVIEAWRSPYFDWSGIEIKAQDALKLDLIARQGQVISGIEQWFQAFDLLERQDVEAQFFSVEEEQSMMLAPDDVKKLRKKFERFIEMLSPPSHWMIDQYVSYVEDLIGNDPLLVTRNDPTVLSLNLVQCARQNISTNERDIAALRTFKDVLRGLVLADAALGYGEFDFAAFYANLSAAIQAAKYHLETENGILVSDVLEARGLSFEAVVLLGLSEGEFPRVEREDMLLWESDRTLLQARGLAIETRLHNDEPSLFYQAVTRARRYLLLSRSYLSEDGQLWEPSPYWQEVYRLFDSPTVHKVRPEDPVPVHEAASFTEFILSTQMFDEHLERGASILRSRINYPAAGVYEGDLSEMAEVLATRYNPAYGWSASRLEAYGICPFFFYVSYVLDLEPVALPEEGFDIRILGSMLHRILEGTYHRAENPGDLDECLHLLPEVADKVFATAPSRYGFRPTPLWNLQQQELTRVLRQTIIAFAQVSDGYVPRYFEERFGMGKPPLILQTDHGDIFLHGFVDRLDVGPDGRLRVVDYKTGGASITSRDLVEGRRLQLPIYALAARDALGLGEISSGFYWHIQKAEASQLKLERYEGGPEGAFETAIDHITRYIAFIRAGEFQPQPPSGGCPSYCPASNFCWRFKPKSF